MATARLPCTASERSRARVGACNVPAFADFWVGAGLIGQPTGTLTSRAGEAHRSLAWYAVGAFPGCQRAAYRVGSEDCSAWLPYVVEGKLPGNLEVPSSA